MTEQTFPSGGTALAEPPLPSLPMDGSEGAVPDDRRRKLMVVAAAAGVLVLAIAAFFLLKGGGSTPVTTSGASGPAAPASAPTAKHHAPKASKPLTLPKSYKGHVGRDPFNPLYVAPSPAPSTAPKGSTSGSDTSGTPASQPSTSGTGTTTTTATSLGRPVWVELVRVSGTKSATFVVGYSNGKRLTTKTFSNVLAPKGATGTIFAKQFSLLSIQNGEATIQFGDGTPIDIAPGAANRVVVN
jgi:hypothetical protein